MISGIERHEKSDGSNHRNGYSSKIVQTDVGQSELDTARDRSGEFEPQLVKKNQRRFGATDARILSLLCPGHDHARDCQNVCGEVRRRRIGLVNLPSHRRGNRPGHRLAIPATGSALPRRLSGLYRAEHTAG